MSYGAIIGDIVGSVYEWNPIKTKEFELFSPKCKYTDDSVCTVALADILLSDNVACANQVLRQWCRKHPDRGYGGFFRKWIDDNNMGPYGSYGNGAAMRVSPVAYFNKNNPLEIALMTSDKVTEITHNHAEGIKGARATTHAIWLAFQGEKPSSIRMIIENRYNYDLSRTVDEIRSHYDFDVTCQKTVPEAITCALESTHFEDAIRNAISLGGDADTQAAIAGSIAEALHDVPDDLIKKANQYLPKDVIEVLARLYHKT